MSFAREASGSGSPCSRQSSDWGCVHGMVPAYALVTRSASTPSDCWSSRLPSEVRPRPGGCGKGESEARMWRRRVYRILGEPRQPFGRRAVPSCILPPAQQMAMMCQERCLIPLRIGGSADAPITMGVPGSSGWIASQLFP